MPNRSADYQPLSAYQRYQQLQRYVNWTDQEAARVQSIGPLVKPYFGSLVDDFYAEIENHPEAKKVITGGNEQIARLKKTLIRWLDELFSGSYGQDYVERRWRVGYRHVEIGLLQVYTNAALSRLRRGLLAAVEKEWSGDIQELLVVRESLNTLLDLDLAIIEDAYQTEFQRRQIVAERQQAEREIMRLSGDLAGSEARYQSLFESTLDGLLILNDGGQIIAANPAACLQLGLADGALVGKPISSLLMHEETEARAAAWDDFFGLDKRTGECTLIRADSGRVQFEFRTVTSFDPGLHLLSLRDVTSRKQAEQRALQAERLAAIGETMAALVHESRNALQRSKASLEMLSLELEDRPEALKLVARAQKAQEDLHRLYEEVREWAAPLNLRRELCNLREIWKEVWCQVNQTHADRGCHLKEEVGCEALCQVDRFTMAQVFRNIFENAVEASPSGAPISIRCSSSSNGKGGEISIAICDRGPGLTAEQRRRIFEPFFTTKVKGTGLGMAIVQRIIQSHGGTVVAESHGGAQIKITLPEGTSASHPRGVS